jgi:hypothetical protein
VAGLAWVPVSEGRAAGRAHWPHLDWQVVENWDELAAPWPGRWLPAGVFAKTAARLYTDASYQRGDVSSSATRQGLPAGLLETHADRTCGSDPPAVQISTCQRPAWRCRRQRNR